jgi:tetratricopeptide (TPR) repeat protein
MDPHAEYEPPEEFRQKFPASLYDGEISFVDQKLPELIQAAGPSTAILLAADHGESLGEHSETTHAVFVYNATLHVPLILRAPGMKAGVRTDPVSLADIAPTILQLAGVGKGNLNFDGVSLLAETGNRMLFAESLYAQRNFGYAPLYACIREGKKYIQAPQAEFYDLVADPRELRNLISQRNTQEWQRAAGGYSKETSKQVETRLPPEEEEKLRSLGYVSGSVKQIGIDPKERMQVMERFRLGMILVQKEKFDQAEERFQEILRTEQHNGLAFRFLGDALSAQHKYEEAARAYSMSVQRLPDPEVGIRLAKAENRLGHFQQAEQVLLDTIKQFPHHFEAIFELSSFYADQQKWDSAFRLLDRDLPQFHNQRGILYTQKGEPQKAVPELLSAIRTQPKAFYWNNLAIARQRLGEFEEAEAAFRQAMRLNPDYEECEANLAFLLVQQKRWKEAETHLRRITGRNQKLWRARLALGFVWENQGKNTDALNLYRKLLAEVPTGWPQRQQLESRIQQLNR